MQKMYAVGFVLCAALIGFAVFSQFQWGLQPCPLCIFQRVAFAAMGVGFLLGAIHAPKTKTRFVYAVLAIFPGLVGAGIAARHVWLTHLPPDKVPSCGPGLEFLLNAFPLADVIKQVLTGSGECAKVDWFFLGLSMPAWSLAWFVALLALAVVGAYRPAWCLKRV